MESALFRFMSIDNSAATLVGHPSNWATVLWPGSLIRFRWNSDERRRCVVCSEPATEWGSPWLNLDGLPVINAFNSPAVVREAACVDHLGAINPCTFNGQERYAPGCTPESPRCSRMHSQCVSALLYLASTDRRLPNPLKVGQCLVSGSDADGLSREESSLLGRIQSGGYAGAVILEPEDGDLWLGAAQFLERETHLACGIPEKFFPGEPSGKYLVPFFVGRDEPGKLRESAETVAMKLMSRSNHFPESVARLASHIRVKGEVRPSTTLVDEEGVEGLGESKIQSATRRSGPQDITLELLAIRGKYMLGREPGSGAGIFLNTQRWVGLELGVEEL